MDAIRATRAVLAGLFFASLACAASSDVVITGQNIGAQILRPIVLSRVFKQGEITAFALPTIGGVGVPSVWQNDVKTRYRDARATVAINGAANNAMTPATGLIRVTTSTPHGYQEGEQVTITGVLGNTAANCTLCTIRNVSATAFDVLNTISNGTYTSGGSVTGPAPGSLKHVLISFPATIPAAPGSITVSLGRTEDQCSSGDATACTAAGLDPTEMLAFNGGTWTGVLQTTAGGVTYSASARDMINGGACTYWQLGPAATSVVCQGDVGGTYDFGYDCTALCTANYSITGATGNGVSPIVLTTAASDLVTGEQVTVVEALVSGGSPNAADGLWTLGAVTSTTAALTGSTGNGTYASNVLARVTRMFNLSTWVASANKGLHPIFVLSFFPGWAGVKVEYIMENESTGVGRDQYYVLDLSTSAGSVYNHAVTQYAWTRWRKIYWDGSEPGGAGKEYTGLKVDYSLAYLIESKIILPYDQAMNPAVEIGTQPGITAWNTRYAVNTDSTTEGIRCYGTFYFCGDLTYHMGSTGADAGIGPQTSWDTAYLYTFDPLLGVAVRGNASNTGLIPWHIRESVSGKAAYDQAGTVASLNMNVSMDSRKTLSFKDIFKDYIYNSGNTSSGDRVTPIENPLSRGHKWTIDAAHQPSSVFVSYLTTGEWWHWTNMRDQSHTAVGWRGADLGATKFKVNGYPDTTETRGFAWTFREHILGSIMAPDGTPEKNYLMQKVNNTIAFSDGALNVTSSKFYDPGKTSPFSRSTETSLWGYGRGFLGGIANGGFSNAGGGGSWPNPLGLSPGGTAECVDLVNLNTGVIPSIPYCGKPFMWAFNYYIMHWASRFGLPVSNIRDAMKPWPIESVQDPAACAFCTTDYNMPIKPGNLTSPTLTAGINNSTLTIPISSFPANWQTVPTPFTVVIDSETLKICSIDVGGLAMTACSGTTNGRAFFGNAASHLSGAAVQSREYFTTWASQATGWSLPLAVNFAWIGGIADSYALMLQGAQSSYVSDTSNGYSGQAAYDILQAAFLSNSAGQLSGGNNDPKFKLAGDPTPPTLPPFTINGGVTLGGGKTVIH